MSGDDLARVQRCLAESQRKGERRAEHIIGLMDANDRKRHEIKRLQRVLVWVYRTDQTIESIRDVISRTIPRELRRVSEEDNTP